jgi:hypothetical protein
LLVLIVVVGAVVDVPGLPLRVDVSDQEDAGGGASGAADDELAYTDEFAAYEDDFNSTGGTCSIVLRACGGCAMCKW